MLQPPAPRSAWDLGLVVVDAEDLAPRVAVARERRVAVDSSAAVRAAVHQPAHEAPAAAVPGPVDLRPDPVLPRDARANVGTWSRGQRTTVGVPEQAALLVDRAAVAVDTPAEVVDPHSVPCAEREAVCVDPRQPRGMRTRSRGVRVAAEVEGV